MPTMEFFQLIYHISLYVQNVMPLKLKFWSYIFYLGLNAHSWILYLIQDIVLRETIGTD